MPRQTESQIIQKAFRRIILKKYIRLLLFFIRPNSQVRAFMLHAACKLVNLSIEHSLRLLCISKVFACALDRAEWSHRSRISNAPHATLLRRTLFSTTRIDPSKLCKSGAPKLKVNRRFDWQQNGQIRDSLLSVLTWSSKSDWVAFIWNIIIFILSNWNWCSVGLETFEALKVKLWKLILETPEVQVLNVLITEYHYMVLICNKKTIILLCLFLLCRLNCQLQEMIVHSFWRINL